MDPPKDKEELQRFLGMTIYVAKFIPNYSQVAAPSESCLKKVVIGNGHTNRKQASKN